MSIVDKIFDKSLPALTKSGAYIGNKEIEKNSTTNEVAMIDSFSPNDNQLLHQFNSATIEDCDVVIQNSLSTYNTWRSVPAPRRGELVRVFGEALRENKNKLATIISHEVGKIPSEAQGEVQEMIDVCDFAVGLSRQLYGLTMPSERAGHRMMEQWHPLGPTLIISAFNFPAAVWAWNACLALVCGNTLIWKPSELAPITAVYSHKLFQLALGRTEFKDLNLSTLVLGGKDIGDYLVSSKYIPLVSATGSTKMGREVGTKVAARFGKSLLELGGNNACVICPTADIKLAIRAILFSAVGTAGQRCTSMRRLIVHRSLIKEVVDKLKVAYGSLKVGNPLDENVLVGPLINSQAVDAFSKALLMAKQEGGVVHCGAPLKDNYVLPAIVEIGEEATIVKQETFAPILYVIPFDEVSDAIRINNSVPQGLSSSIFTNSIKEAEIFLSATGSDCGIANVNMGGSGAEIGGAFGGEKETGGGRECGSDSWKAYMRRMTSAINYSDDLPLAQGVVFGNE